MHAVVQPNHRPPEEKLCDELCGRLAGYLEPVQVEEVRRAYRFGAAAHAGQRRNSGEAYICHPLSVAIILADMRMDPKGIVAALLHDVIEDTPVTKAELTAEFGQEVAELVDGVTKLTKLGDVSRAEAQAVNMRKMFLAMINDLRVILVKLADRLHNMRTLGKMDVAKRRRIARETLEIYAPLANRLGMNQFRLELEELGFAALHPWRQRILENAVRKARGNRKEVLAKIQAAIVRRLQECGLECEVIGREKHLYSLYQKMRAKRIPFLEVFDVCAFRLITRHVDDCYRALGVMHNLYRPLPGRFKDYIALPKGNGYQSLHTVLAGPYGQPLEIQIRTRDMHGMAESGIAAHWLYKSENEQARVHEWLHDLLEIQQDAGDSLEFLDNLKVDLFQQEVFVFTPKGKIIKLPRGATLIDFAYAVHTGIGNTCQSGRIDRHAAPLQTVLENGQTVEIVTATWAHPNPLWLNYAVTAKARSRIRASLRHFKKEEAVRLGRRLLDQELAVFGVRLGDVPETQIQRLLKGLKLATLDQLLEDIGLGNRMPMLVAKLLRHESPDQTLRLDETAGDKIRAPLVIKGTEGVVVNLAKCCHPIPGDPILGFFNPGKGIVVHTLDCRNVAEIRRKKQASWLQVEWDALAKGEFAVEIRMELINQRGTLAQVASVISRMGCNIENVSIVNQDEQTSTDFIVLTVRDRVHLAQLMRELRKLPVVLKIARVKS
ncbi:MAG TPA: bifunctional (p)ppGpp synthetase/guanosine-3',5'-bis(diphosphate) 3'-pyrophosphohydrolase [Methylococcaceae bacterium]|nr:bifunctional (p)ppGpp synthetase/guanosine-3',5'-bis(diphosphate) 3'-pyrophosphohydrolase [Methylococcaceae bacterium]